MSGKPLNAPILQELEAHLPSGTAADRTRWARTIVDQGFDIRSLSPLLLGEKRLALRCSWLLSDIGMAHPEKLKAALPELFRLSQQVTSFDFQQSFATYWHLADVPAEQEATAIDLCFGWLNDSEVNVTTKTRALWVLEKLVVRYPEIAHELRIGLEDQLGKNSVSFDKRAQKLLSTLKDAPTLSP